MFLKSTERKSVTIQFLKFVFFLNPNNKSRLFLILMFPKYERYEICSVSLLCFQNSVFFLNTNNKIRLLYPPHRGGNIELRP